MPRAESPRDDRATGRDDRATGRDDRAPLRSATVAIIGCGGLGSSVAEMLVRSGVGALVLIDFDRVEEDNLNRQLFFRDQLGRLKAEALAETLRRIDPSVHLDVVVERVTAANLLPYVFGCDVLVEAVDGVDDKAMIVNVCTSELPEVPLVTVSGLAGSGSANEIVTQHIADNVYLVGDLASDVRDGLPLYASRVMVAAAHQAHVVVRVLLGLEHP
ncbi:MAG: sulfur carrier protein ThiS adenylyltransferase ThiF [Actinomycetota bacterium]|nr:sulfur carrier protein ThiS adenylyltransferase ThiF [Actinomycetota bacterium]